MDSIPSRMIQTEKLPQTSDIRHYVPDNQVQTPDSEATMKDDNTDH
jgi:hypothetical protein